MLADFAFRRKYVPSFAVIAKDKPNSLDIRKATRAAHLAYLEQLEGKVSLAGPLIEDMLCGSLLIFTCGSREELAGILAADPYAQAGLFAEVDIFEWVPVIARF